MISSIFYYEPEIIERLGINHQDIARIETFSNTYKEMLISMNEELDSML